MEEKESVKKVENEEKNIERRFYEAENRLWIMQLVSIALVIFIIAAVLYAFLSVRSINTKLSLMQAEINGLTGKAQSNTTTTTAVSNGTFGRTLAGIDTPLNSTELAAINDAPNNYFEQAGEMVFNTSPNSPFSEKYENGSYVGAVVLMKPQRITPYVVNGKPSVIYLGAISCIFCGENRWSMALALSRFGKFGALFKGYSSFGDGDVPTLYWNKDNYTTQSGATFGNMYSSNYINFISAEYDSPITQGFSLPQSGVSYFIDLAPNSTYRNAYTFVNNSGRFEGTPFTIWGSAVQSGADAVAFGTVPPGRSNSLPGISYLTHRQLIGQIASFNTTLAEEEYAGADVYIAEMCPAINNTAQVCSLPAIQRMEAVMGFNTTK
ncbi:MAG: DUF929 family protein [Candidatus Micrarchaeia archaeon]